MVLVEEKVHEGERRCRSAFAGEIGRTFPILEIKRGEEGEGGEMNFDSSGSGAGIEVPKKKEKTVKRGL